MDRDKNAITISDTYRIRENLLNIFNNHLLFNLLHRYNNDNARFQSVDSCLEEYHRYIHDHHRCSTTDDIIKQLIDRHTYTIKGCPSCGATPRVDFRRETYSKEFTIDCPNGCGSVVSHSQPCDVIGKWNKRQFKKKNSEGIQKDNSDCHNIMMVEGEIIGYLPSSGECEIRDKTQYVRGVISNIHIDDTRLYDPCVVAISNNRLLAVHYLQK